MNAENREGWICPKCRAVHSPDVKTCHCIGETKPWKDWPPGGVTYPTPGTPTVNDVVRMCPKCGLQLQSVMGYVCNNHPCPTGLGGTYCGVLNG